MRRLILSLLLASLFMYMKGEFIYFDRETGFGPFAPGSEWRLRHDSIPASVSLLNIDAPAHNELTMMTYVKNRRGGVNASGTYVDAAGKRRKSERPGMRFIMVNEVGDTLRIEVRSTPVENPEMLARESFTISWRLNAGGVEESHAFVTEIADNSPFHNGSPAALSLQLNSLGCSGTLRITEGIAGRNTLWNSTDDISSLYQFLTGPSVTAIGLEAMPGGEIDVVRLAIAFDAEREDPLLIDPEEIETILKTTSDPYAGYWRLTDFSTDDSMLLPGGEYVCAMIPSGGGRYKLLYLSGAQRNAARWLPGMLKATLRPAGVPGAFRATWLDAEGRSLDNDCAVQMESTRLLTVQFPHLISTLRMHKIKKP